MSSSKTTRSRFQRLILGLKSRRAKHLQVTLLALLVFATGIGLAFSDVFYNLLAAFTPHPEMIPISMLVLVQWLVFEVALLGGESQQEGQVPQAMRMIRDARIQEWVLSRETMCSLFADSSSVSEGWRSVADAKPVLHDWILGSRPNVQLDILAFSTETFLPVCLDAAREMVSQSEPPLEEVSIRILVRDTQAEWLIPYIEDPIADHQYVEELKVRFLNQQNNWAGLISKEFRRVLPAKRIELEMRVYPFEPTFKGIVVNREVGVVGIYPLGTTSWRGRDVWDYLGHESAVVRISKPEGDEREQALFGIFIKWFDETWESNSRPWRALHGSDRRW